MKPRHWCVIGNCTHDAITKDGLCYEHGYERLNRETASMVVGALVGLFLCLLLGVAWRVFLA